MRFNNRSHDRFKIPRNRARYFKWYPCPGFIADPLPRFGKFERWQNRPQKAWDLYWKTHPELYQKICQRGMNNNG